MSRVIEVVDYDPVWIATFEKEAAILNAVVGQRVIEVHHIGSTAVPVSTRNQLSTSSSFSSTQTTSTLLIAQWNMLATVCEASA
jgi:hypothetical protein